MAVLGADRPGRGAEGRGAGRLGDRRVDARRPGAVHPVEGEEVAAVVDHGDVDLEVQLLGLRRGPFDDRPGAGEGQTNLVAEDQVRRPRGLAEPARTGPRRRGRPSSFPFLGRRPGRSSSPDAVERARRRTVRSFLNSLRKASRIDLRVVAGHGPRRGGSAGPRTCGLSCRSGRRPLSPHRLGVRRGDLSTEARRRPRGRSRSGSMPWSRARSYRSRLSPYHGLGTEQAQASTTSRRRLDAGRTPGKLEVLAVGSWAGKAMSPGSHVAKAARTHRERLAMKEPGGTG